MALLKSSANTSEWMSGHGRSNLIACPCLDRQECHLCIIAWEIRYCYTFIWIYTASCVAANMMVLANPFMTLHLKFQFSPLFRLSQYGLAKYESSYLYLQVVLYVLLYGQWRETILVNLCRVLSNNFSSTCCVAMQESLGRSTKHIFILQWELNLLQLRQLKVW